MLCANAERSYLPQSSEEDLSGVFLGLQHVYHSGLRSFQTLVPDFARVLLSILSNVLAPKTIARAVLPRLDDSSSVSTGQQ